MLDLGILPTHLALSGDASYLAMAGVRHEVGPPPPPQQHGLQPCGNQVNMVCSLCADPCSQQASQVLLDGGGGGWVSAHVSHALNHVHNISVCQGG